MKQSVRQVDFLIPINVISEMNCREHWRKKNTRKKAQQEETAIAMLDALRGRAVEFPCVVKLCRIGAKLLDDDNLRGAFKGCRDQIARMLKVDDADPRIKFEYDQLAVGRREYHVHVEIKST